MLKPATVTICHLLSTQFRTFLVEGETEQEITQGLTYYSTNQSIVGIGAIGGKATGISAGIATVSVQWQDLAAQSQVTVLPECCDDVHVGMIVLIDNSKSMGQAFSPQYSSKLTFAKQLAAKFASELNTTKDKMAVMTFNAAAQLQQDFTDDVDDLGMAIAGVGQTTGLTNLQDGLMAAIDALNAQTGIQRRAVVLFTDGNQRPETLGDPLPVAEAFISQGGLILVAGIRAADDGYTLLQKLASGGFFINCYKDTQTSAFTWLPGLKGYFCAGSCTPPGGECVHRGQLSFGNFINWDVISGDVDLIGGSPPEYARFDLLPGNGSYVDMVGSHAPWNGKIATKDEFSLSAGAQYELSFLMAGNQREEASGHEVRVRIETLPIDLVDQIVTIDDWKQDFTQYTYLFTPSSATTARISFEQIARGPENSFGLLLDAVRLRQVGGATVFFDNFDADNTVCLPNECNPPDENGIPPPGSGSHDLINIDFRGGEEATTTKTGAAAVGQAGDFWNTYHAGIIEPVQFGAGTNLIWADQEAVITQIGGNNVPAIINEPNYPWQFIGSNGSPDTMMDRYVGTTDYTVEPNLEDCLDPSVSMNPLRGCRFVTLTQMPTGVYDFYVYGHGIRPDENSRYAIAVSEFIHAAKQNNEGAGFLDVTFTENEHYVKFSNVMVNFGEDIKIFVIPPEGNSNNNPYSTISGIQIKQVMAPSGVGGSAVAPTYAGCYGYGCLFEPVPSQNPDPFPAPDIEG